MLASAAEDRRRIERVGAARSTARRKRRMKSTSVITAATIVTFERRDEWKNVAVEDAEPAGEVPANLGAIGTTGLTSWPGLNAARRSSRAGADRPA
jgi:hypothetical protein